MDFAFQSQKVRQSHDKISRQNCLNNQNCNKLSQRAFLFKIYNFYMFLSKNLAMTAHNQGKIAVLAFQTV